MVRFEGMTQPQFPIEVVPIATALFFDAKVPRSDQFGHELLDHPLRDPHDGAMSRMRISGSLAMHSSTCKWFVMNVHGSAEAASAASVGGASFFAAARAAEAVFLRAMSTIRKRKGTNGSGNTLPEINGILPEFGHANQRRPSRIRRFASQWSFRGTV